VVRTVISRAFEAYRALFRTLVGTAAVVVVPYEAALLALQLSAPDTDSASAGLQIIDALASVLVVIPLVTVAAMRAGQLRERGEPPKPRAALVEGFELLPAIAGTQLLVVLAIALLPGLVILAGAALGFEGLIAAGLLALLVSAIANGVRLALAVPVVLLEGPRYGAALRRSADLVRGRWRWTFLTLLALFGCALVVNVVVTGVAVGITGPDGRAADVAARISAAISTVLVAPFLALGSLALYRELAATPSETATTA
jgi:hypothetical protein